MRHSIQTQHSRRLLFLVSVLLLVASSAVYPCRIVPPPYPWPTPEPVPRPHPSVMPVEVREHRVQITIDGSHAEVTVDATFHNPNARRIEGTYVFPIPAAAAVSSFAMTVNGKTLEAELLEAGKAREIYEEIVRKLKDPALLEYLDQGLLKARIFPIEAHQDVTVHLTYDQGITQDGEIRRFSYPLLSAKPDGDQRVQSLRIEATVTTEEASLKTIFCPGFDAEIKRTDGNTATVVLQQQNVVPNQDFDIVFSADHDDIGVDMLAYREAGQGFFMMLINPDSELQAEEIAAKEITFVLDTSGSMMGSKLKQAKQALQFCIENLNAGDTFNITAFATDVRPFAAEPVLATVKERQRALDFITELRPRGGTAIGKALDTVLGQAVPGERVSFVVFLTDGLPTIGEVDPDRLLENVKTHSKRRFFTFGVGDNVNTRLLDGVAALTGGYSTYVRPGENLELALSSFYEKIAYPVMTDLKLDTGDIRLYDLNPSTLPSLFRGGQITVTGKFDGKGSHRLQLSGLVGDQRETVSFEVDVEGDPSNAFIPRLWAVNRVGYLQEQIRIHGRSDELVDEIKRLGRKYGIVTPYTSFLVVEEGVERERLEVARRAFRGLEQDAAAEVGANAVEHAQRSQAMKSAGAPGHSVDTGFGTPLMMRSLRRAGVEKTDAGDFVRHAHDKTFYYRRADQFWYDADIPPGETAKPDIEVTAWSDAFFELLDRFPNLRRYVKVSPKLVVRIDGTLIRVAE